MIYADDGSEAGITTFTDRGIESLKEFLADIHTWHGGVRQFLVDKQCDRKRPNASWRTSRNHKRRGLRRMDKMQRMARAVIELGEQGSPAFNAAIPILLHLPKVEIAGRGKTTLIDVGPIRPAYLPGARSPT